jgi:sarcosine oxidase delta subunit
MTFKRRIPEPTRAEQARHDQCRRWGCIACHMQGLIRFNGEGEANSPAGAMTIHHQTENGFTQSQAQSVCLCTWHHQGHCRRHFNSSQMRDAFGPSLAKGTVSFFARYGRNAEQLEFQNELIAGAKEIEAAA